MDWMKINALLDVVQKASQDLRFNLIMAKAFAELDAINESLRPPAPPEPKMIPSEPELPLTTNRRV